MTDRERIRELEEALESCLDWAGELQERCDALERSKAIGAARALGASRRPREWLRLPGRLWSALRSSPPRPAPAPVVEEPPLAAIPRDRPIVAVLTPWLEFGGAEKVVRDVLRALGDEFAFVVVATERGRHRRRGDFLAVTPWVYVREEPALAAFLRDLRPQGVLVSATRIGYRILPELDDRPVWRADLLHNVAPEGCIAASILHDERINVHFCVGFLQSRALRAAGVAESKIRVTPNTVDAAGRFDPSRYERPEQNALTVGVVARLSEEKGVELFIDAFALARGDLPELRGVIIGDGPERIRLERRIRDQGLADSLKILGYTARLPETLTKLDIVVLPSRVEGASPNAVLEAMAMERYVIAADVGGVGEAIEDGVNGRLLPERTPEGFAAAMVEGARDPELRRRIGAAARRTTLERFQPDPVASIYREAMRAGTGRV